MKPLKYVKKINEETAIFAQMIEQHCDKINKEYMKQLTQMLKDIAIGENLDYTVLKHKYMKSSKIDVNEEQMFENVEEDDTLLDKIVYNNTTYYVDKKNGNIVYDTKSTIVGKYQDGKIVLSNN